MYLIITHANEYIERSSIEEKGVNKFFLFKVFDSTDENKELLKNTMMFLMELETK